MSSTEGITIPDLRTHDSAIVRKTIWRWHRDRHADQQDKVKDTNMIHRTTAIGSTVVCSKPSNVNMLTGSNCRNQESKGDHCGGRRKAGYKSFESGGEREVLTREKNGMNKEGDRRVK